MLFRSHVFVLPFLVIACRPTASDSSTPIDAAPAPPDAADAALSSSASVRAPTLSDAQLCDGDPQCSPADVERLFRGVAQAGSKYAPCDRFLDGNGVSKDLVLARTCLVHTVAPRCQALLEMDQAELALMLADGVGGPRDLAAARPLLVGCDPSYDFTLASVRDHVAKVDADPATPPLGSICTVVPTTDNVRVGCDLRRLDLASTAIRAGVRALWLAVSDPKDKYAVLSAYQNYNNYDFSMTSWELHPADAVSHERVQLDIDRRTRRATRLTELAARVKGSPPPDSGVTVAAADAGHDDWSNDQRALAAAKARASTPAERKKIETTEEQWLYFRPVEVALYDRILSPEDRADAVRILAESRARDLDVHQGKPAATK